MAKIETISSTELADQWRNPTPTTLVAYMPDMIPQDTGRGVHPPMRMLCNHGGYHVWFTQEVGAVECEACLNLLAQYADMGAPPP